MNDRIEIGGYFGLETVDFDVPFGDFSGFQSARAACHAALAHMRFSHALIPAYVCDSIILAAERAGSKVQTYEIDENFLPKDVDPEFPPETVLLYVNYFGMCSAQAAEVIARYGAEQVIVDQSQALFARPSGAIADIYSPRKFVGLPDGGFAMGMHPPPEPAQQDTKSIQRLNHLFKRYAHSARDGYADFNKARLSLSDSTPLRMSRLTRKMLSSINWAEVRSKRQRNFAEIDRQLGDSNKLIWSKQTGSAPLCYPYHRPGLPADALRKILAESFNIFSPVYWPDVAQRAKPGSFEEVMLNETLYLPIDQRMSLDEVSFVSNTVLKLLAERGI